MLQIIDTHLHFLDCERFSYPWLNTPGFEFLHDGYSPDDWKADVGALPVVAGVHVQAEVDHAIDPVEETRWLSSLSEPVAPLVYVGYADLRADDLGETLAHHCKHTKMRGIRQELWYDPNSTRADLPRVNMLDDPAWRTGLEKLTGYNLSLELLVWHHQLEQAAVVFANVPEMTVVVEHLGLPPLDNQRELRVWREGLRALRKRVPGSVLKLSGVALSTSMTPIDDLRPIILQGIEEFGPERCMFGSNYPVDRRVISYTDMWAGFADIVASFSPIERNALFSETASRTYRMPLPELERPR